VRRFLRLLVPVRIGSQIAVLVVAALVLAHVVLTAGFFLIDPRPRHPGERFAMLDRLVFLAKMMDAEPDAAARAHLLATARLANPSLTMLDANMPPLVFEPSTRLPDDSQKPRGDHENVFFVRSQSKGDKATSFLAAVRLSDGTLLAAPVDPLSHPPLFPMTFATLAFLASAMMLLTLWAARQLTAPLVRFADAAERFTASAFNTPLAEDGPLEVRRATKALNDMQQRISKLVADRTQMLAAISHDLRTPITRLRLRAEDVEPQSLRQQILRDLATMQNLVRSALSFLREHLEPEAKVKTDLPPLVQTVCDGFSDVGHAVHYSGLPHFYIDCEPEHIMRAVENLIDNGLKFGHTVAVRVAPEGRMISIEVQDDGPGIPNSEKPRVIEPFYRGDAARSLNERDSFGLGLSIAKSVVERSGGTFSLLDAKPHGLIVRVLLPVGESQT
jgi:signal transduction histidine kinase